MSDSSQPIAIRKPNPIAGSADKLTPKLRAAINLMVWEGMPFNDAAQSVGMHVRGMRLALTKPHVIKYLQEQRKVLLYSHGPRNIKRLAEIRDAADNMPAVNAIKELEELVGYHASTASQADSKPFSINIINGQMGQADVRERGPIIDVAPSPSQSQPADDECLLPDWRNPKG